MYSVYVSVAAEAACVYVCCWCVCECKEWSGCLVAGQLGEGGVHLVSQALVSVLVDSELIC